MVDGSEREKKTAIENFLKIGDAVEDADEVDEARDEADDELGEDGFGNVFTWPNEGLATIVARLTELEEAYLGISSARWVTTSGVPTE